MIFFSHCRYSHFTLQEKKQAEEERARRLKEIESRRAATAPTGLQPATPPSLTPPPPTTTTTVSSQ